MKILLDSHVLLWWLAEPAQLGAKAKGLLEVATDVGVPVISLIELYQKQRIKKLSLGFDLLRELAQEGFGLLEFDTAALYAYHRLPPLDWRDPFDHLIISQAVGSRATLCTADRKILASKVPGLQCIDARK